MSPTMISLRSAGVPPVVWRICKACADWITPGNRQGVRNVVAHEDRIAVEDVRKPLVTLAVPERVAELEVLDVCRLRVCPGQPVLGLCKMIRP